MPELFTPQRLPSGAHPDHLPAGPIRALYRHLYDDRMRCDRGTVMWHRLTEHMDTVLSLLSEMRETGWVPVTERMPDMIGNYLVTNADGLRTIAWAFFNSDGRWCGYNTYYKNVTHWMPLPEAPHV